MSDQIREKEKERKREKGRGSEGEKKTIFVSHFKFCFQQVFKKKIIRRKKKEIELELAKDI